MEMRREAIQKRRRIQRWARRGKERRRDGVEKHGRKEWEETAVVNRGNEQCVLLWFAKGEIPGSSRGKLAGAVQRVRDCMHANGECKLP